MKENKRALAWQNWRVVRQRPRRGRTGWFLSGDVTKHVISFRMCPVAGQIWSQTPGMHLSGCSKASTLREVFLGVSLLFPSVDLTGRSQRYNAHLW
jgi:hypothetical protein